jgi:hypothetical protein
LLNLDSSLLESADTLISAIVYHFPLALESIDLGSCINTPISRCLISTRFVGQHEISVVLVIALILDDCVRLEEASTHSTTSFILRASLAYVL